MSRCLVLAALALATATGCDGSALLVISLRTDLVPGVEFDTITTQVDPDFTETRRARGQESYVEPRRVAEFSVAPGVTTVRVSLYGPELEQTRPLTVSVSAGGTAVTAVITRDCRGVECPGDDDPNATACLGGRCIDPRCAPETPGFCPDRCGSDVVCEPPVACASAVCLLGACFVPPGDCGDGAYCDPDVGCVDFVEVVDAGGRDAGREAGDAGIADTGLVDGGVEVDSGGGLADGGTALDLVWTSCAADAPDRLKHSTVVAFESGGAVTGQLASIDASHTFVDATLTGEGGEITVSTDGTYTFTPSALSGAADGSWRIELPIEVDDAPNVACLRIHVVNQERPNVVRLVGSPSSSDDAWDPPGVPVSTTDVYVEPGTHVVDAYPALTVGRLFVASGGDMQLDTEIRASIALAVGGRISGSSTLILTGVASVAGRVTRVQSLQGTQVLSGALWVEDQLTLNGFSFNTTVEFGPHRLTAGRVAQTGSGQARLAMGSASSRLMVENQLDIPRHFGSSFFGVIDADGGLGIRQADAGAFGGSHLVRLGRADSPMSVLLERGANLDTGEGTGEVMLLSGTVIGGTLSVGRPVAVVGTVGCDTLSLREGASLLSGSITCASCVETSPGLCTSFGF